MEVPCCRLPLGRRKIIGLAKRPKLEARRQRMRMPYTPNPQHRSAAFAAVKSQWSIALAQEHVCYDIATRNGWTCGGCFWGLYLPLETPAQLGVSPSPDQHPLKIAKFVGDDVGNWHGYPVAHWLSPYDKPDAPVLKTWFDSGFISRPTMAKIHRGKKCIL